MRDLEALYPGLRGTDVRVWLDFDDKFNCIAWAVGVNTRWLWPEHPPDTRTGRFGRFILKATLADFETLFESYGFEPCDSDALMAGFEKAALFATPDGFPTHAARQLPSGRWTSKLGDFELIEHDLRALEGEVYGRVVRFFRRPAPTATPP